MLVILLIILTIEAVRSIEVPIPRHFCGLFILHLMPYDVIVCNIPQVIPTRVAKP